MTEKMCPKEAPSSKPLSIEGLSDDDAIPVVIEELEKIPNRDEETILGSGSIKTVNQLIDHLRRKTPEGMKHLGLYRRAEETVKNLAQKKESALSKLRRDFQSVIERLLR